MNLLQLQEKETQECPKMLEVSIGDTTWQTAFCFALATEQQDSQHSWKKPKLLMTIIGGADSTVQSMKVAIDGGLHGMSFGHGVKSLTGYEFKKEVEFSTERGKYNTFPISVNNRKVLAIVHDDILEGEYVLSMEGDPADDIRRVLGGAKYGLPILSGWKEKVYLELERKKHLDKHPVYFDKGIFPLGIHLLSLNLDEQQADDFISTLIKSKIIQFPLEGEGKDLEAVDDLTEYMQTYSGFMIDKLSQEVSPTHNPLVHKPYEYFETYDTQLFPVQSHVSTAIAKRLKTQKSIILQGEMSTGKSKMMTAIADAYNRMKGKVGFHAILMVPPSLTDKWTNQEIFDLLPKGRSKTVLIEKTEDLIRYHQEWTEAGRPKAQIPTFFICSFTTMRGDCSIEPAVRFQYKKTAKQAKEETSSYRNGYHCPDCGQAHQVIESTSADLNEEGEEVVKDNKRLMQEGEFGTSRRIVNSQKPANAYCSECGSSLWTKRVPTRYSNFKEWSSFEKLIVLAAKSGHHETIDQLHKDQPDIPKKTGKPRRIATIEYIRRKMKNFFDVAIVDEIHELKGGATAQGNALGALASAAKKVVGGTGTLFGGKAEDVYYHLWRLFPYEMVKAGYKYSEVQKWNLEYGNIETVTYHQGTDTEYTNKQSRGGTKRTQTVKPGISPFVFGRFLVQNTVLVRLKDVWPDPVELIDVPTIFVDPTEEMMVHYDHMKRTFENKIEELEDGFKLWLPFTDSGIAYPDNMFSFPDVYLKTQVGGPIHIWKPGYLEESTLLPKEKKLQEIVAGEIAEGRPSIVYVRDTGSTKKERDIQPRLQSVLEQVEGAKVAILRSNSTDTDKRTQWLRKKVEKEGYNVIIVSTELVKVGLDLLCTPTLIFYQFSWSLFTMAQAAKRAWRIGQTKECRLFYLAYKNTFQETMAQLIAKKNKAAQAINGDVSSDGLNAMLGDDGDLQSLLIKSVKDGDKLQGSTEEWVAQSSDRARELLSLIGKKKAPSALDQYINWVNKQISSLSTRNVLIKNSNSVIQKIESGEFKGFEVLEGVLTIDLGIAFGLENVTDGEILSFLVGKKETMNQIWDLVEVNNNKFTKRQKVTEGQLAFNLFD